MSSLEQTYMYDAAATTLQYSEHSGEETLSIQELVDSQRGKNESLALRITELVGDEKSTDEDAMSRALVELEGRIRKAKQLYEELEKSKAIELKAKDEKNRSLEQQLEIANALMRTVRLNGLALTEHENDALSPAAAAASKLLKSGMPLTQIYSLYTENHDALQALKEENSRLNQYVNEIIQEREKTHSEADESGRKASHFQQESQEVEQLNLDLNQQLSEKDGELKAAETRLQQPGDAHGLGGQADGMEKGLKEQNEPSASQGPDRQPLGLVYNLYTSPSGRKRMFSAQLYRPCRGFPTLGPFLPSSNNL